jgi:hypothetical protein
MIKQVKNFPSYQIDDKGNVYKDGILKQATVRKDGYLYVNLKFNGKKCRKATHRLVASTFLGHKENKVVRHLNGIKLDNRWCNLKYGTEQENNLDGRIHSVFGNVNAEEFVNNLRNFI